VTSASVRIVLPYHLKNLAKTDSAEVSVEVEVPVTPGNILDGLEARYPVLRGTIRDHVTLKRRPLLRYFACEQDFSHVPTDTSLPESVASGAEPFLIVGAVSGG
jgi:sulfur-carrier protein